MPVWLVEAVTLDPPAGFAIVIYRWKARDEQIDGANRQARFESPAGPNRTNLEAVPTVFRPGRPTTIVPTPCGGTSAPAGPGKGVATPSRPRDKKK